MTIRRIQSGSPWEDQVGYARAVVAGDWVHVAGTTGTDPVTGDIPDSVEAQCALALRIIRTALDDAGCGFDRIVRVRYILPHRADFRPCWPILQAAFGSNRPAATMIEAGLIDPRHRIEIEVDAWMGA